MLHVNLNICEYEQNTLIPCEMLPELNLVQHYQDYSTEVTLMVEHHIIKNISII
jgi:hypothetical protein